MSAICRPPVKKRKPETRERVELLAFVQHQGVYLRAQKINILFLSWALNSALANVYFKIRLFFYIVNSHLENKCIFFAMLLPFFYGFLIQVFGSWFRILPARWAGRSFFMLSEKKRRLAFYVAGSAAGRYSLVQAAESTGYTVQWLCHLRKLYRQFGPAVFEPAHRLAVPANKIKPEVRQRIVALYSEKYADVNFKFFMRCLEEFHGIKISYTSLRRIFAEFSVRSPEGHKLKKKKPVKRPRFRRENAGDLIQIDGTPYAWFYKFGNQKLYSLMGSIDDATGKITGLYMCENECLYGYLEILRQTCKRYGVPRQVYSDRAAIFCVTRKGGRNSKNLTQWELLDQVHDKRTQWQRICSDLGIEQILAWSPQAKGRVERMWRTVQQQLPQLLFNAGVQTVEGANAFLASYINRFNSLFSVPAKKPEQPFWTPPPLNLDDILCAQIERTTDSAGCFSFHAYRFHVERAQDVICKKILICISERGVFAKTADGLYWPVRCMDEFCFGGLDAHEPPQVLQEILYRYLYAYAKEISC